jgi:hypothetical protein
MMAPDRSHESGGGRFPSPEALSTLRSALSGYLRSDTDDTAVCDALRVLAQEAKDRQLYAEQLLIAFKRVWADMPELVAIPSEGERRRMLDHLVKVCIDMYYAR